MTPISAMVVFHSSLRVDTCCGDLFDYALASTLIDSMGSLDLTLLLKTSIPLAPVKQDLEENGCVSWAWKTQQQQQ